MLGVASVKTQLEILLRKIDITEIYMRVLGASSLTVRVIGYDCKLLKNEICLLHCNSMHLNLQGVALLKELKLFQAPINALDRGLKWEKEKTTLLETYVQYIAWNAIPILYSSNDQEMERERSELDQALSQVREHIKYFLSQFGELKLHKYPKTDPFAFLEVFCSNLKELRVSRPKLIEIMNTEIEVLHLYFNQLRSFFSIPECLKRT
ncbi:hypothetical protein LIER_32908 [Lithospermum erythrorhizon]|uniref:Uncharacterized protein n=1 Tax=Lithospermum erythrorhizon TaxID=34254 RepID=A0AAV3RXP4_LITER